MKYYKAFNKGMTCRGKQYEVGKDYEEQGGKICGAGMMHFCKTPFDTLDYYPLIDNKGNFSEFAEVEPLAEVLKMKTSAQAKRFTLAQSCPSRNLSRPG